MDGLALALVAVGFALYAYSYWGMRQIIAGRIVADPGRLLVEKADHFRHLSTLGVVVAGAGLIVAVISLISHSRSQAPHSP
jgi:hypothetical protein